MQQLADPIQANDLQNTLLVADALCGELKLSDSVPSPSVAETLQHASLEAAEAVVTQC